MSNGPGVGKDFIVISSLTADSASIVFQYINLYLVRLVSKEMNLLKFLISNTSQRICFVPAIWEDIKRDLATNGESQVIIGKLLLENFDEIAAPPMLLEQKVNHRK